MKSESQAAFEGPFILSEGSVRAGTRGERKGREEEGEKVCKDERGGCDFSTSEIADETAAELCVIHYYCYLHLERNKQT